MKHTKGHWELDWLIDGKCNIDPKDGYGRIATVWIRSSKTDNISETEANAYLIVSAPDLLEVCKELLFESEKGRYKDNRPIAMAQGKAQQVIAKIDGRDKR